MSRRKFSDEEMFAALAACDGNRTRAAEYLSVYHTTVADRVRGLIRKGTLPDEVLQGLRRGTPHDADRADRVVDAIRESVATRGYPPSVRELMAAVGLHSEAAVAHQLNALVKAGRIEVDPKVARGIRIVPDREVAA